ncbi:MAG: UDP-glucuronic acid decarboxylase family protein [Candidatus Woesearchaeota archaeon]
MRVVVTGGAGFLGSHLCRALIGNGDSVVCVDDLSSGNKNNIKELENNPRFEYIKHDIIEPIEIAGRIDQIYHLASRASPPNYQNEPVHTALTNSIGTNNMLRIAHKKRSVLLFASTSEVYGDPQQHPQKEAYNGNVSTIGVRGCYDESKRFGEALCMAYYRKHNVGVRIARIFNTYGPMMYPNDGRVVSTFVMQALHNKDITVFGDGSQTRSFCYVDDMIKGLRLLMNSDTIGPVNLGNPHEISVLELAKKIIAMTKSRSKIIYQKLPEDDPFKRMPDISVALSLGWHPETGLEQGLRATINYFKG